MPDRVINRLIGKFLRYVSVGVLNTALHWCAFFTMHLWLGLSQAESNLWAFLLAVTFSFCVNARWTFRARTSAGRYVAFVVFMGALSYLVGRLGDSISLFPLATLALFSALSLLIGFAYSNWAIFKDQE